MDRIDVLIDHHTRRAFAAPYPTSDAYPARLTTSFVAARTAFWLTLGGFAGFVYSYGWLVG